MIAMKLTQRISTGSVLSITVCVLLCMTQGVLGDDGCCSVRRVSPRQPRFCAFDTEGLMCSADAAGSECKSINNFGIAAGAGFPQDFVDLAQIDSDCVSHLLAFFCSQRCGDCYSYNSTFIRRGACKEFVLIY